VDVTAGVIVFRIAADIVVALHAAFALFVALGALLAFRWRRVIWAHLPAIVWGIFIELSGWVCPLTPLENTLRLRAGESAYSGDFIQHYVVPVLYPANLTRETQLAIGIAALAFNALMYWRLFRPARARDTRAGARGRTGR
jgi:uncharacterized protein DUF2784